MTVRRIAIDANVLVALVDANDKWHVQAIALRDALLAGQAQLVYFDCVVNETVGVIGRRAEEQKRSDQFGGLLNTLSQQIPPSAITWISRESERMYQDVLTLCRAQGGRLIFNDALMALLCREQGIDEIASFDRDFDELPWLTRVADPAQLL
jgi:predicted nucleic acid-binding protein